MNNSIPLHEIIVELEKAGHTELWLSTALGNTCLKNHPLDQSQWYLPNIVTRDGRTVANRVNRPNDWLLSGDWTNINCRPGSAAPYNAELLEAEWRFQLIAKGK